MPKLSEKVKLKLVFFLFSPFFFAAFLRLFWLVFYFILGWPLIAWLGPAARLPVFGAAALISLTFSFLTCRFLYRQFRYHIVNER